MTTLPLNRWTPYKPFMLLLILAFWLCLGAFAWTYVVYPFGMMLRGALAGRHGVDPAPETTDLPKVTAVVAVRNGQDRIEPRVRNLFEQEYPENLLSVTLVLNGCTDESERVARALAAEDPRLAVFVSPAAEGKAGALNLGVANASGEAIVFADVRQTFQPDAVIRLVRALQRPNAGAVTGRLVVRDRGEAAFEGTGHYWAFETRLRLAESRTGSVVGATGAIYALWKPLFDPIPPGTLLDDVYVPLRIAMQGYRVLMEPEAVAEDEPTRDASVEYGRRVRTLLGNLQLVRLLPKSLLPWRNPIFIRFISHKLSRVYSPLYLVGMVTAGLLLGGKVYGGAAVAAMLACAAGLAGILFPVRALALPAAFVIVQIAALEAIFRRKRTAADVWGK